MNIGTGVAGKREHLASSPEIKMIEPPRTNKAVLANATVEPESGDAQRICLAEFDNRGFARGRSYLVEAVWLMLQALLISSSLPGSAHRRWLLRLFGAEIGRGVRIKPRLRVKFPWRLTVGNDAWLGEDVWIDNLAEVAIGPNCCISQGAYLCTGSHDWSRPAFDLVIKPIRIGEGAWIAAKAIVAPGVFIGEGAVLALGSVATSDLDPWTIYQGVPAKPLGLREPGVSSAFVPG